MFLNLWWKFGTNTEIVKRIIYIWKYDFPFFLNKQPLKLQTYKKKPKTLEY